MGFKESLPALIRDLFTFSSKVIRSFIIVYLKLISYPQMRIIHCRHMTVQHQMIFMPRFELEAQNIKLGLCELCHVGKALDNVSSMYRARHYI
jgi:hypothetical protein